MKLSEFRSSVQNMLDDTTAARWSVGSTTFDRTKEVDYAIELALDKCLSRYASMGGGLLDEEVETTTDASGVLDMSTYRPAHITAVMLKIGNTYYPISSQRPRDYENATTGAKTIRVRYVRTFDLDSTAATDVIAYGATGVDFPSFDHWIVATAADYLTTKTAEPNQLITREKMELEKVCTERGPIPATYTIGRFDRQLVDWYRKRYAYIYRPNNLVITQRTLLF
jgi:hypothetical protein